METNCNFLPFFELRSLQNIQIKIICFVFHLKSKNNFKIKFLNMFSLTCLYEEICKVRAMLTLINCYCQNDLKSLLFIEKK